MNPKKNVCGGGFETLTKRQKQNFFENYLLKQKYMGMMQRKYKKVLTTKTKSRNEVIIESSYFNTIKHYRAVKNDLRAQIYVATGTTHLKNNKNDLKSIQCHVDCQENLAYDIQVYKTNILNMEREISRVGKEIYTLNRKTVPDAQHQAHVAHIRKILSILGNQLEVGICRECGFMAANSVLKEELTTLLSYRTVFNEAYAKLVAKLNNDKKYLTDLIEYAIRAFEGCRDIYEKIDHFLKRTNKENENRKAEMQALVRETTGKREEAAFLHTKGKERKLADLQPKEYRRREAFRKAHNKNINLYNKVVNKILEYSGSAQIEKVIEKFKEQESLYYTYFNYANEMSYHMTLLSNSVTNLYDELNSLKHRNHETKEDQLNKIAHLEERLRDKQEKNRELKEKNDKNEQHIKYLLENIQELFQMALADATPLKQLLGDYKYVNLISVREFLKILEKRINDIVAVVYISYITFSTGSFYDPVVKDIEKYCDWLTDLNDIVLTQQCPECAEGEAFNMDDADEGGIVIHTKEETINRLKEKVNQPEMQYRLHSVSQCRLPRSRAIAAKRNL